MRRCLGCDVFHWSLLVQSFQKEIILNTERIDGLIVFGESLIQKSSPQDAALIEEELEELHSYCQEVFSRLVRFHQRLSQPPVSPIFISCKIGSYFIFGMTKVRLVGRHHGNCRNRFWTQVTTEEPKFPGVSFSMESSLELIGRPWLGRGQGSLPATPSHLLAFPLEQSGRETPVSVDSLPLEWDHTGDVGGSSHEDDEDDERHEEEGIYFSALSGRKRIYSTLCPVTPPRSK